RSGRLSVRVATWLLQAYSTRFLASISVILVPSALPVEPNVFKAPAIILAIGHNGQPFDLGHPAGRGAQMVDDRSSEILLQFMVDIPDELLALGRIGFRRLLIDHLVELFVAVAHVVARRA